MIFLQGLSNFSVKIFTLHYNSFHIKFESQINKITNFNSKAGLTLKTGQRVVLIPVDTEGYMIKEQTKNQLDPDEEY